jgi:hypothetical protein
MSIMGMKKDVLNIESQLNKTKQFKKVWKQYKNKITGGGG